MFSGVFKAKSPLPGNRTGHCLNATVQCHCQGRFQGRSQDHSQDHSHGKRITNLQMLFMLVIYLLVLNLAGCNTAHDNRNTVLADTVGSTQSDDSQQPDGIQQPGIIPLELTTHLGNPDTFRSGDEIQLLLSLGDDAYIYLYHETVSGELVQLLPSPKQSSSFYRAGYFLTVPEYEQGYRFVVEPPYGRHRFYLYASNVEPVPGMSDNSTLVGGDINAIRNQLYKQSKVFGEAVLELVTVETVLNDR